MKRAQVEVGWRSHAGHRHRVEGRENEDAVYVTGDHPVFDALLIVADGMGGHPRPREAAEAAVLAARRVLESGEGDPADLLAEALEAAGGSVRSLGSEANGRAPGTTLSVVAVHGERGYLAHVGDGSVLLVRGGRLAPLAGGEGNRNGTRPGQYLGQREPLLPELREIPLEPGDRLLLCTDGLTRYFREAGSRALVEVLSRPGTTPDTLAQQLTAHSRSSEYDDDTTVALVEVKGFREEPGEGSHRSSMRDPGEGGEMRRSGPALAVGMAVGAVLLAAGFGLGRWTAAPAFAPAVPAAPAGATAAGSPGELVLLDAAGGRVWLSPKAGALPGGPTELRALRMDGTGRLADAGRYRLDPARGVLTDPSGRRFAVEVDPERGVLRARSVGSLEVNSRPAGARVRVDGRDRGRAPCRLELAEGRYRVEVEGLGWRRETEVVVPASGTASVTLSRP